MALAAAPAVHAELDAESFAELADRLADSPGFKVRLQAAVILGRTGGERALDPLARALAIDPHFTVRGAAAIALGNLGDPRGVEPLVKSVDSDPEPFVRDQAALALAKLASSPEAVPYLVAARDRADKQGRLAVTRALAARVEPAALRALAESLADADSEVGNVAADALSRAPPAAAGDALMACLGHSNYKVREAAAHNLGLAKEARAVDALAERLADPVEVPEVQLSARRALAAMKDQLDVYRLVRSSREAPDKRERARALVLLGAVGGQEAFDAAAAGLRDKDIYVRGIAATVLGTLDDPRAVPLLEQLLEDAQANARIVAVVKGSIARLGRSKPK